MPSLYPGACGFGDMCSRFLYIRDMPVNAHGNIDRNSSNSRNQGHVKRREFLYRCLLLVEGFIKVMNSLQMTLKEEKGRIFKCLVAHSQLYSSKCDLWIICLVLGNFSSHAAQIVYAIAWRLATDCITSRSRTDYKLTLGLWNTIGFSASIVTAVLLLLNPWIVTS